MTFSFFCAFLGVFPTALATKPLPLFHAASPVSGQDPVSDIPLSLAEAGRDGVTQPDVSRLLLC